MESTEYKKDKLKLYPEDARVDILFITSGAVLISFSAVWVQLADINPNISAFYRLLFGSIFLSIAAIKKGNIEWEGFRHLVGVLLCGFIFALDLFLWHRCIRYVGPGLATLLGNFQVFFLTAIGILFLGEKARLRFLLSIPMALGGLALIVGIRFDHIDSLNRTGIIYGFLTALCYTSFILTLKKLRTEQRGDSIFYIMTTVSIVSTLFLGAEAVRVGDSFSMPDLRSLISMILLGLFSQCIGWILITNALPRIRASRAGMILLLQPSLAFLWDVLFFGRDTTLVNWIGVIITLSAIYMGTTGSTEKK